MRINMKKQIILRISLTFIILTICSCKQDPIFKTISEEEKQLDPHIEGSPTNFVSFKGHMYVGSGTTLYKYKGTKDKDRGIGNWEDISFDGNSGNILQLAETGNTMYALCGKSGKNVIKRSYNDSTWRDIPAEISVQRIYAVNDQVFIGAGTLNSFTIYRLDGDDFTLLIGTQNRLLNGAAFDGTNYYLIAKDMDTETGSTYKIDSGGTTELINSSIPFMGILNLGSVIVAISRDGILYNITHDNKFPKGPRLNGGGNDKLATGALAVWTKPNTSEKLLLAGRQDDMKFNVNYLQGYQELELDSSGNIIGTTFLDPGLHSLSTVENNASYKSNMEKNPVNHLYQDPNNSEHILFASTQTKGVWSYRLRDGRWQWNAEQ